MVNEIVWVYGSSAVGKETFIRKLADNPPMELIKRLGWENKKLVIIWESIDHLVNKDDSKGEKRKQILDKVLGNKGNDIVIIKGQDIDIVKKFPQLLKKKLPTYKHKIIQLYTDIEVVFERCKNKFWWGEPPQGKTLWHLTKINQP